MAYIVEITPNRQSLSDEMAQMRTWLDHKGYRPIAFRSTPSDGAASFRVEFGVAAEADGFARAFGPRRSIVAHAGR